MIPESDLNVEVSLALNQEDTILRNDPIAALFWAADGCKRKWEKPDLLSTNL